MGRGRGRGRAGEGEVNANELFGLGVQPLPCFSPKYIMWRLHMTW